ncbi:hypothetical protein Q1695_003048 [Nippostrongylus brasiliensis]|nr:hypothetical protein Q1695_003048 [Nippostrongylus brasiliensis]
MAFEKQKAVWRRDFRTADYLGIKQHLANVDWIGTLTVLNTVNEQYEAFLAILHHVIDLFVPLKKTKPMELRFPNYLKRMNSHRSFLWDKASFSSMDSKEWADYKTSNAKVGKALYRYNLYKEKKILQQEDTMKFYSYINSCSSKKKGAAFGMPTLRGCDGSRFASPFEKANLLAGEF